MISYPRTLVCYWRFDTVFTFIVNLYRYHNVFKSILPANVVNWFGKAMLMPNYWLSRSALSPKPSVRYETWGFSVLSIYCWHVFCFGFLYKFDVCMIGKTIVLVIFIHKRVKSIVFAMSIKLCDESGLAILKNSVIGSAVKVILM